MAEAVYSDGCFTPKGEERIIVTVTVGVPWIRLRRRRKNIFFLTPQETDWVGYYAKV